MRQFPAGFLIVSIVSFSLSIFGTSLLRGDSSDNRFEGSVFTPDDIAEILKETSEAWPPMMRGSGPPVLSQDFWTEYREGAHGHPETGVDRLARFPIGHCLQCHDIRTGYSFYLLFMPYTTEEEMRSLCFYCHDGLAAPIPPPTEPEHDESATTPCVECHDPHIPD